MTFKFPTMQQSKTYWTTNIIKVSFCGDKGHATVGILNYGYSELLSIVQALSVTSLITLMGKKFKNFNSYQTTDEGIWKIYN